MRRLRKARTHSESQPTVATMMMMACVLKICARNKSCFFTYSNGEFDANPNPQAHGAIERANKAYTLSIVKETFIIFKMS